VGQPPAGSCDTSPTDVPANLTALNITSTSGPNVATGNASLQAVSCTVPALQGGAYLLEVWRWSSWIVLFPLLQPQPRLPLLHRASC
jgi:hypothetical protein